VLLKNEKIVSQTHKSSLLITASGLISKILAAIYRIPYQNIVGDRGFYAYQQVYPFLAIVSALSLTALPNVISSFYQHQDEGKLQTLFKQQLVWSFTIALLFIVGHAPLANVIGSPKLAPSIVITGLVILTVPFTSFYRGMAQAENDMVPTALSQVIEQVARVLIIIISAICFMILNWTIYLTANVAASGNLLASLIVLYYLYRKSSVSLIDYLKENQSSDKTKSQIGMSSIVFIFFSVYLLLFQLVDSVFIKNSLVFSGYSQITSEMTKGIFDRGQPLIQFGLIFSTAFFTTYLPILTKLYISNNQRYTEESQHFLNFIIFFNVTITIGFISILRSMNIVLFENNKGWLALSLFLVLIFLSSVIQFFHQKLFIENRTKLSFSILLIGLGLKTILTPILTYLFAINGSALSSLIPLILVLYLYVKHTGMTISALENRNFWISVITMSLCVIATQFLLKSDQRWVNLVAVFLSSFIGLFVFYGMTKKLDVFDQKMWSYLPFKKEK